MLRIVNERVGYRTSLIEARPLLPAPRIWRDRNIHTPMSAMKGSQGDEQRNEPRHIVLHRARRDGDTLTVKALHQRRIVGRISIETTTVRVGAVDCGMTSFYRLNAQASNDALRHFNAAIALDPEFAAAYGMAAWCYVWRIAHGWMIDPAQEHADAVRLARCAIELGRDDAVALGCGGWVLGYVGGDLEAAAVFVDRARALNPQFVPNWYFSGWLRTFLGHPEAAMPHFAQVMRLSPSDPLLVHTENGTAWAHFLAGRYDEALSWAERALLDNPHHKPALRVAAATKARLGRRGEARSAIARMGHIDPEFRICDVRKVAPFRRPEDLEKFEDSLRRAGLRD
jgi:tetratricopeptide (TPR) repeat protein